MSEFKREGYAINAIDMSFTYQEGTLALSDITFQVAYGEFVAL